MFYLHQQVAVISLQIMKDAVSLVKQYDYSEKYAKSNYQE
jgi:hypothetical protein